MTDISLNDRARHLLRALIDRYIAEGTPVGSSILAKESGLELSSATVRNVLADLEDMGLITSPHTSSGRVPTAQGYRVFVDNLLTLEPLDVVQIDKLKSQLKYLQGAAGLVQSASNLISGITRMAGIVTIPIREETRVQHIEFLPLGDKRVLVVLIIGSEEIQNRVICTERNYSRDELQQAANYLNEKLAGRGVEEVKRVLVHELEATKRQMDKLMVTALEMARQILTKDNKGGDYVLSGEVQLMTYQDISDVAKLRELFEAFNEKREILHLFDHVLQAEGVQIFIGEESGYAPLGNCSVVTSPYRVNGKVLGVLGIIGPTRMNYRQVIPIVDITAKLLGSALKQE